MSSIGNLASTLLHAVLPINLFPNNTTASTTGASALTSAQQPDSGQLSSFAQLANTLQQLQQSNPTEYTQVTQKIAANLQSAAQTAQASGNTTAAAQLNQLATDFSNASATGQLPNLQDLAQAVGGHHGHHHAAGSGSAVSQLLSSLESASSQNGSVNAATVIQNTLTSSGITTSSL
jgi:aromatic ring hydroxylase